MTFDVVGPLGLTFENFGEGLEIVRAPIGHAKGTELRRGDVLHALNGDEVSQQMRASEFVTALSVARARGPATLTFQTAPPRV